MRQFSLSLLVFLLAFGLYLATVHPSITWWDSAEYITCAHTLGIPHPPGSIVLVLFGRIFSEVLTLFEPAFRINLMIALCGALTVLVVYRILVLLMRRWGPLRLVHISAILGAFTLAFALSVWQQALKTNPYALSLFFSALIVWASLRWWEVASETKGERWLVLIIFLLGLDIGVHRNNVLLIPALFVMVLLKKPGILKNWKLWIAAPIVWILGFSVHTVFLIRSGMNPPLDATNPETLRGFWDWLALKQVGTGLLPDVFQRKAPFWSYQIKQMYLRYFDWNFLGRGGREVVFSLRGLYAMPALVGVLGLVYHFFKEWRRALYLFIAFCMTSLGAIIYLNVPPAYFREIDRHFLASFLLFGLWIGIGAYGLLAGLRTLGRGKGKVTFLGVFLLAVLLPISVFRANLSENNSSGNYFAYDFAYNLLQTCEPDAILFTNGDSDTFPLWYLQIVEGIRRDVSVVNIPLLAAPWWRQQLLEREPEFPVSFSQSEWEAIGLVRWDKQTVRLDVPLRVLPEFGIKAVASDDTFDTEETFQMFVAVEPTFEGTHLLPSHRVILDILEANRWDRPLYFALTVAHENLVGLRPFLRLDGLARRVTPIENPPLRPEVVKWYLFQVYQYRNTSDPNMFVDETSRALLTNYKSVFLQLAQQFAEADRGDDCIRVLDRMEELFPEDRFPDPSLRFSSMVEEMYRRFGDSGK